MQTILAIDDERSVRETFRIALSDQYAVITAEDGSAGLEALERAAVDLIILDHVMPKMDGLEFLRAMRDRGWQTPVIMVTALNSVNVAVDAMKLGARDYLIKPFDIEQLVLLIARVLAGERERSAARAVPESEPGGFEAFAGSSAALQEALDLAREAAAIDSTLLVTGESGSGKDLLARAIHTAGPRRDGPFVHVSCCALPSQLIESELFGHERGAFTGASERRIGKLQAASGGTAFLDEIGEMSLEAQTKLLHVLQENAFYPIGAAEPVHVDVRFICATNRDLEAAIAQGEFREDLYYRINVLPITMPPLRKRREDIGELVEHFTQKYAGKVNASGVRFGLGAVARLAAHNWPGNVRELENVVQRVLIRRRHKEVIDAEDLDTILPDGSQGRPEWSGVEELEGLPLEQATAQVEARLIRRALQRCGYVQSRAAELLGTTRRVLKYKMDQLDIPPAPPEDG